MVPKYKKWYQNIKNGTIFLCLERNEMKKFYDLILEIQNKNEGYLNLVQNGIFVQAIGRDATKIRQIFSLKPVCFKENICKCVIPVSAMEKYIRKLIYDKYAFTVNKYDKETNKIIQLSKVEGNKMESMSECETCEKCWYKEKAEKKDIAEIIKDIDAIIKDVDELKEELANGK